MNVLSTTRMTPACWWTTSASALMSTRRRVGLVGDSTQTSFVFGLMTALTLLTSLMSTNDASRPLGAATLVK